MRLVGYRANLVGPTPWFTKAMKDRQITNIRSNSHATPALLADKAATTDDMTAAGPSAVPKGKAGPDSLASPQRHFLPEDLAVSTEAVG